MPHPTDGSVWYTSNVFAGPPGFLRFDPKTNLSEFYAIPKEGIGVRGGDIDKNGVLWGSGSNGHLVSFDRSKCKGPLNGPQATGDHCPEGFAFHKYPGPSFEGFENGTGEASYYTWVDHHNTVGLGENVPISTANLNDGFVAFKDGQMVMLRIPYPTGLLRQGAGRAHRRSERRLEGTWAVEHERRPHALADGGRQGLEAARRAHPGAARSAGALAPATLIINAPFEVGLWHIPAGYQRARRGGINPPDPCRANGSFPQSLSRKLSFRLRPGPDVPEASPKSRAVG